MKVLVACEFSGIVRDAFLARGHDAWSCDTLDTEKGKNHIKGNVLDVLGDAWDLMIAHPPCTYLSYAGTSSWADKGRIWKRLDALRFFALLWTAPINKICIENPGGCASPTIAKFSQIIQPWQFGETESKRTWLWLKNLPQLKHSEVDGLFELKTHVKPRIYGYLKRGKKKGQPLYVSNYLQFQETRGHDRSRFWPLIAKAMAEQWGG